MKQNWPLSLDEVLELERIGLRRLKSIICHFGRRSLLIATSTTLRVRSLYVFSGKITNLTTRGQKRYNFKTVKGRNLKFKTETGHIQIIINANFEGNQSRDTEWYGVIRVFEPKTEMPIRGLNNSRSKTNCWSRKKVSNFQFFSANPVHKYQGVITT